MTIVSKQILDDTNLASRLRVVVFLLLAFASHMAFAKTRWSLIANISATVLIVTFVVLMVFFSKRARQSQFILNSKLETS